MLEKLITICTALFFGCSFTPPRSCPTSAAPQLHFLYEAPIQFDYSQVPTQYHQCIENAMLGWNEKTNYKIFVLGSKPNPHWTILWENQRPKDFRSTEQGKTTLSWVDQTITHAWIRINNFDFKISSGEPGFNEVDCESLMIHEMGHAIGLNHIEGSVMSPTLPSGITRREFTNPVVEAFQCIYAPQK